ncbi:uncharacterized protein LOC129584247 [Paramacrobiotus metropolitanus]|uniref:uncharacterized protein LOC129584247 n=1 Tax=Paramacrobiotus metropolitanus TaxID=2943436 RepID=UPI0024456748|nr:uncharacterized protein LOC129584247 [Paramacrobiotus metropolitanus]
MSGVWQIVIVIPIALGAVYVAMFHLMSLGNSKFTFFAAEYLTPKINTSLQYLEPKVNTSLEYPTSEVSTTLQSSTAETNTDNPVPDVLKTAIVSEQGNEFPVHIVRLYKDPPSADFHGLCWTQCLSIASVILFVKPAKIYIHTNYPDYWPFTNCYMITNYSMIEIIYTRQRFTLNGRRLDNIFHEADVVKYNAVYEYGGMVTDLDVFYLPKINALVKEWREGKYECLLSRENSVMNSGFIACRKKHPYIRDILMRYRYDYQTDWLHNSGSVPFEIYNKNPLYQKYLYVDAQMSNHSKDYSGPVPYNEIPAWHYFDHHCEGSESSTLNQAVNSSFWEMLHFIQGESWKVFQFPTTTSTQSTTSTQTTTSTQATTSIQATTSTETTTLLTTNPVVTSTIPNTTTSEPNTTTVAVTTLTNTTKV